MNLIEAKGIHKQFHNREVVKGIIAKSGKEKFLL